MRVLMVILVMCLGSHAWAQDCEQTIVGGATFWTCDDLDQGLADRAKQGNKTDQYMLGMAYLQGKGVPQDYGQAAYWFSQSAEQGVAASQYQLGLLYAAGNGVEKSIEQAVAAWSLAALKGYGEAQFRLAQSYDQGAGFEQDFVQAYVWYSLAASATLVPMQAAIDRRDAIQAQLSDDELETAETMRKSIYQQILMNKLMR